MKKSFSLILITSLVLPAFGETASGPASTADSVAGMLMLVGEFLLVLVALLVALAWIWFPFMVKHRLDKIIRKLDDIEQLQGKIVTAPAATLPPPTTNKPPPPPQLPL